MKPNKEPPKIRECTESWEFFPQWEDVPNEEQQCQKCAEYNGPSDAELDYTYGADGWRNK